MIERIVSTYLFDPELNSGKMIFLTGPRQVGKTTFARSWLISHGMEDMYFNWDDPAVGMAYKKNPLFFKNIIEEKHSGSPVPLVFDEIHKQRNWRNILKGIYDTNKDKMTLLVTGSARLSLYRKSGDSLAGRYFLYQIFPLGLPEVLNDFGCLLSDDSPLAQGDTLIPLLWQTIENGREDTLSRLSVYGGFPEPFTKASVRFLTRWQREYKTLLTREDVRDFSRISDLRGMEQLVEMLPTRVGSPLSVNSLSEDLGHHYSTIANWIEILKQLYLVFTIRPWHKQIVRSIKKEVKLYYYDWAFISDLGFRFENLVAMTLVRMAARFTETGLGVFEIMYLRDREKREVDFVLIKDNKPVALFEAKEGEMKISPSGRYFAKKLGLPYYQIINKPIKAEAFPENCYLIPAASFLMLTG